MLLTSCIASGICVEDVDKISDSFSNSIMMDNTGIISPIPRAAIKYQESLYTQQQLEKYLDKIRYPKYQHLVDDSSPDAPLLKLQLIMRLHLVTFPFDNTDMHYTESHVVDITAEGVYQKLIIDGTHGSYCFGQNNLLLNMLRRLGYRAYSSAGHVLTVLPEGAPLPAWSHMLLFVQPFDNSTATYLVDVGYGASGLCRPILFTDDPKYTVQGSTKTERHRLIKKSHHQSASPTPLWYLQLSHNPHDPDPIWRNMYAFPETEVYSADYLSHNYAMCLMSTNRGTLRSNIVCVRHFLVGPEAALDGDVGRYVLYSKELKRSVGGQTEVIETFGPEDERKRILALKEHFGIIIGDEGEKWIKDSPARL